MWRSARASTSPSSNGLTAALWPRTSARFHMRQIPGTSIVSLTASPALLAPPPPTGGAHPLPLGGAGAVRRGGRRKAALLLALALHAGAPLAAEPVAVAVTNAS